ncbi:DUF4124 domain-containing protein [Uliginosibacterium flavum]|uniref:DUF4124 domain-containing protein n=1 Tax=Uliginosibacterium flavum TaxID=1396831 RepID=A0ABV2TQR9_9RHOO
MAFKFILKSLAMFAACALPMLASAQVYTWKDANGRTHFADQPPVGTDAKPVRGNIVPPEPEAPRASGSAPSAKASGPRTWEDQDRDYKQRKTEQAEADAKAKKEKDAKAEKDKYCSSLRSNLAALERGGRMSKPNAKGEPDFLSENQMKSEADRIRSQIASDCK